ncbi:MAG: pyridine nucleotide-disulfide oxidoreductase, partial [Lachnospiraceae bacterium]|nr:pyridine nucleotide-disulfide oxidoreductase [Lachnospiraceae bacterium]
HMDSEFKVLEVFFRVRAVLGACHIYVRDEEGTQIAKFSRERVAPGEMETIKIPKVLLEKAKGAITVSVEEDQEVTE